MDEVKRVQGDAKMFTWGGRVCYPELGSATCAVKGKLSLDGRAMTWEESGGHFNMASTQAYMPDTGHIVGIQSHVNGSPLANLRMTLLGRNAARRIVASLGQQVHARTHRHTRKLAHRHKHRRSIQETH